MKETIDLYQLQYDNRPRCKKALIDFDRLMEYIARMHFETVEEYDEFLKKHVSGKSLLNTIPPRKGPKSKVEKSRELLCLAYDSMPHEGKKLAKQALQLDPSNLRTYLYLADCEKKLFPHCKILKKAIKMGAYQFHDNYLAENESDFFSHLKIWPYLFAKLTYTQRLHQMKKTDDVIIECRHLLKINPSDFIGARHILSGALLANRLYDEYYALHKQFENDMHPTWLFNYALYLFVAKGATTAANKVLLKASKLIEAIPYVIFVMMKKPKEVKPLKNLANLNNTVVYLWFNRDAWLNHPETGDWLGEFVENMEKNARGKK